MAYSTPRTWSPGEVPTAAQFNQDIRDNVSFLANPPACRARSATNQTLTNNLATVVLYPDTDTYDTDNMHSTSSNTGRMTFNTAGLYMIEWYGGIAADNDYTFFEWSIRLNGSTQLKRLRDLNPGTQNSARDFEICLQYKFAATNYIEVLFTQQNTSAGSAAMNPAHLTATWLGLG